MNKVIAKVSRIALAGCAALGIFMANGAGQTFAAPEFPEVARAAFRWVEGQQQPDGSFPGFGAGSTVDAVLAFIAIGADPTAYSKGGNTPVTFLESKAADLAKTPGGAGKLLIAVASLGLDTRAFGGVDLIASTNASYDPKTGQYGKDAIGHAFAMLGLHVAGESIPTQAVAALKSLQAPEGGWAFSGETTPGAADTNTTAVAIQALVAAGEAPGSPALQKALAYLRAQQNSDGGFPYQQGGEFGSDSDVNSTSYVVQALVALGEVDMAGRAKGFIRQMQKENGAFQWKADEPDDNAGATYQAIPALLNVTLVTPHNVRVVSAPSGMPTTGAADWLPVGAFAGLAALLLAGGLMARRKAIAA